MRKGKLLLFTTLFTVCSLLGGMKVNASDGYYKSRIANGYHYSFSVSSTAKPTSIKLIDILYHTQDASSEKLYIEVGETLSSTATAKVESAISSTVGAEVKQLGVSGKAELSSSIMCGLSVENSVSKTYKQGYEATVKKKDKKGWYALESVTYGRSLSYRYAKESISKSSDRKVKTKKVTYNPNLNTIPAKRLKWYKKDPQQQGIYTKY